MAIKQPHILTRQEFDEAVVRLRLNVSEVSRDTGIPRTYLSEFRNGDRQLRPENLAKLRDYFESKGLEFEESQETTETPPAETAPTQAAQEPTPAPAKFWPVFLEVPQPTAIKVMGMVQDNDARLAVLLQQPVERDDGFFGDGELSSETKETLQEVFTLMAANFTLFRMMQGWPALGLAPSSENPETLRDIVFSTFQALLEEAGLLVGPTEETPDAEEATA